jgi:predicted transcriptional regulator
VSDEPEKKAARRQPTGKGHKATAAKPRATPKGPGNDSRGGPGGGALSPKLWIAARAMYESDKDASYPSVAKEFGISTTTVSRRAREERWTKNVENLADMSERAHHIADTAKAELDAVGPDLTPEKREEVQTAVTIETGAEVRAKILKRHREEWAAPRKIAYEAIQKGNAGQIEAAFSQAKLAKITSEVLINIQNGERKAWGMDKGEEGGKAVTVVIERD